MRIIYKRLLTKNDLDKKQLAQAERNLQLSSMDFNMPGTQMQNNSTMATQM